MYIDLGINDSLIIGLVTSFFFQSMTKTTCHKPNKNGSVKQWIYQDLLVYVSMP